MYVCMYLHMYVCMYYYYYYLFISFFDIRKNIYLKAITITITSTLLHKVGECEASSEDQTRVVLTAFGSQRRRNVLVYIIV